MRDRLNNQTSNSKLRATLYLGGAISMAASVLGVTPATFAAPAPFGHL
ncbi:MAG: hypothetical protein ACYCT0_09345 [Sulfobacillus sp.]